MNVHEDEFIYIELEKSQIPWLKVFTKKKYKELSECDEKTASHLLKCINIIEKEMISFYNPTKINIASFGNYVPLLHIHIMARFENDNFFPESMWGKQQRKSELNLPKIEIFLEKLKKSLNALE